jgi:hypothetical protein
MELTHMQLLGAMGMTYFISSLATIFLNIRTQFEAVGIAVLATFFLILFALSSIEKWFAVHAKSEECVKGRKDE